MPRPVRWLLISIAALLFLALTGVTGITWWSHLHESTYYGRHTDILHVGERITTAQTTHGVVQSDPAWDEDSCDPDRPISVRLDSGEVISLPRHSLHR